MAATTWSTTAIAFSSDLDGSNLAGVAGGAAGAAGAGVSAGAGVAAAGAPGWVWDCGAAQIGAIADVVMMAAPTKLTAIGLQVVEHLIVSPVRGRGRPVPASLRQCPSEAAL